MNNWSRFLVHALTAKAVPWRLAGVGLIAGTLAGLGAYQLDSGRVFSILAPPALILILLNLAIYLFKIAKVLALPRIQRQPRLATWLAKYAPKPTTNGATDQQITRKIAAALAIVSNAVAVGLAVGVIAGIYLRGLVVEYQAGWESTLLDSAAVSAFLHVILSPSAWVIGLSIPGPEQIAVLRIVAGQGGGEAKVWLHLWSASVALWVIVPRLGLALAAISKSLRHQQTSAPTQPATLPAMMVSYCLPEAEQRSQQLASKVAAATSWPLQIVDTQLIAYGEEEKAAVIAADSAQAAVVLVGIASTPEQETHGKLLDLLSQSFQKLAVVLDDQPWQHGRASTQRIASRIKAWQEMVPAGTPVVALSPDQSQTS